MKYHKVFITGIKIVLYNNLSLKKFFIAKPTGIVYSLTIYLLKVSFISFKLLSE